MHTAADVVFGFVAFLHAYFFVLEALLWTKPMGLKTFGQTREQAEQTKVLAQNQGLYNLFLTAGIVWALCEGRGETGMHARVFFGAVVVVAGIGGWLTTKRVQILFIQAVPAAIALALLALG